MKGGVVALLLSCATLSGAAAVLPLARQAQAEEALLGFDPILLVEGKEVLGRDDVTAVHGGLRYFFASEANRERFLTDPDRYGVQLGGVCARMGGTVGGDPDNYLVHDGRIYIFGSETCRERFAAAPTKYLMTPEPPVRASAAAMAEGRALIDRAVAAAGGAAAVDGVRTWRETRTQSQPRPDGSGVVTREQVLTMAFPHQLRIDRVFPQGTASSVVSDDDAFMVFGDQVRDPRPGVRDAFEAMLERHLMAILQARVREGFAAAALGTADAAGVAVTRVDVQLPGGARTVLGIDGDGRIRTQEFQGRDPEGAIGLVVLTYSDVRTTAGIRTPRRVETTVAGEPDWAQSAEITDLQVNLTLPPMTFARPGR